MKLVKTWEDIKENLLTLDMYKHSKKKKYRSYYKMLLGGGKRYVVGFINNEFYYGPSRFVGYVGNNMEEHEANNDKHGGHTNIAINKVLGFEAKKLEYLEEMFSTYCEEQGINLHHKKRRYWFIEEESILTLDLTESDIEKTEKETITKIRIGQRKFRGKMIEFWEGKCSVTGVDNVEILRASHIKPWHVCKDVERLDEYNGLLLIPNLDTAFDKGLISFNDKGKILISSLLEPDIERLGINKEMKIKTTPHHKRYLDHHRKFVFRSLSEFKDFRNK